MSIEIILLIVNIVFIIAEICLMVFIYRFAWKFAVKILAKLDRRGKLMDSQNFKLSGRYAVDFGELDDRIRVIEAKLRII